MATVGIITLALAGLSFAGLAMAFGMRKNQLEGDRRVLRQDLSMAVRDHELTKAELAKERARSSDQLEHLREQLNDLEDLLAACSDPAIVHDLLDRVLQEASGGPGPSS